MSGQSAPADHSVELAQMEQDAARQAREEQARQEAEKRAQFESRLGRAYTDAIGDAEDYFTSRGLNPQDYMAQIQREATRTRGRVPDLDAAPGTYFDQLGPTVFNTAQDLQRGTYGRQVNQFAPEGFSTKRIASTSDDAILDAIYAEQFGSAEQYIRNLLDRGVINPTGFNAAKNDLTQQGYGVKSRLTELGNAELERGRGGANEIANEARRRAANYELGTSFDPFEYSTDLDEYFTNFMTGLGGNLRAQIPTSLFNTAGLAGIAGAGQGAQNLKFDPRAIAGLLPDDDEEDDNDALPAF